MILKFGELKKNKHEDNMEIVDYHIELLTSSRIDEVMALQSRVYEDLPNKDIFQKDTKEELLDALESGGHILGIIDNRDQLIGYRFIAFPGIRASNLGNDINLPKSELKKVVTLETTIVHKDYRGNGLQDITLKLVKSLAKRLGYRHLLCTVSPDNFYSLYNNMKNGLKINRLMKKYSDSWRFVLHLDLEEDLENPIDRVITQWTDKLKQRNLLNKGYIGVGIDKETRNIEYALFDESYGNIA